MAELDDAMIGAGLLAGGANVIMQLAHPAVGYGVVESRVQSGRLFRHPVKRTRTTLTYLAVALLGTDGERKAYRRAVTRQHVQVRSTESSPVRYNAMDPALQLWVAACLYRGFEDTYRAFGGSLEAAEFYPSSATLGTTLQVRADMWPPSRAAFEEYWNSALDRISIDDTVRGTCTTWPRCGSCRATSARPWRASTCSSPPDSCPRGSATRCGCRGRRSNSGGSTG